MRAMRQELRLQLLEHVPLHLRAMPGFRIGGVDMYTRRDLSAGSNGGSNAGSNDAGSNAGANAAPRAVRLL